MIFFFSWQNLYNAIVISAESNLFYIPSLPAALGTSHACASRENYENKSIWMLDYKSAGVEASKVTKLFYG